MKKVIAILVLTLMLAGCNKEVIEEITFEGQLSGQVYMYGEFFHLDLDENELVEPYLVIGDIQIAFTEGVNGLTLSDSLNQGLFLPNLEVGEYDFYIQDGLLEDANKYQLIDDFNFVFYPIKREGYKEIKIVDNKLIVSSVDSLPENVYDIVIDPGHGGIDGGANSRYDGEIYLEKDEVLAFSLLLEQKLSDAGYKVKLTRTEDEYPGNKRDMFADGGRIDKIFEASPKIVYSTHLNAHPQDRYGFEVYATSRDGVIADFVVDELSKVSNPSNSLYHKARTGVYSRYLSEDDIQEWKESLESRDEDEKYEMFEILLTSKRKVDYYVVVRELGALATDAYEDGRRPKREANEYRNSIYGIEGVLIELAYIDDENDFFNFKNDYEGYANALVDAFKNYVNTSY